MNQFITIVIAAALYIAMFLIIGGISVIFSGVDDYDTEPALALAFIISLLALDIVSVILMVQNGVLPW